MNIQNQYLISLASKNTRMDGRKPDEYRKIVIERDVIAKAEGSARVKIGNTEVIAGVKMDVGTPFSDRPEEGVLMTNAEFSPVASPTFEKGPPSDESIELARVVDRGIRESGMIDVGKLCIEKGSKVWMVNVDIQIVNHDGNLIDAASLASVAALLGTRLPAFDGEKVDYEAAKKTKTPLPITGKPVAVTLAKVGSALLADPRLEEESAMATRLTVATKDDGSLAALQKGGGSGPLAPEEIEKAFELSERIGKEIRKLLK
jgi:exosome complex component RRP42